MQQQQEEVSVSKYVNVSMRSLNVPLAVNNEIMMHAEVLSLAREDLHSNHMEDTLVHCCFYLTKLPIVKQAHLSGR